MKNSSGEVDVHFRFRRAGRILAAGALVFLPAFVSVAAKASPQAAAAPTKNYKDREEYDAYQKVLQTTDMKARLEALKAWEDKYPTTDFISDRNALFLDTLSRLAASDPSMRQPLLAKCQDVLKADPKNGVALFLMCQWGPIVGGATPNADLVSQVDSAAHAFISNADDLFKAENKPQNLADDQWQKAKIYRVSVAHNALAWAAVTKKDYATAENEYTESLKVNPDQGTTSAQFGKMLFDEKKYSDALYHYARTAQYTGPGPAQTPAARQASMAFFDKLYKSYHGSDEGKDAVLSQAKGSALPPAGFKILSVDDIVKNQDDELQKKFAADPSFKLWYSIKSNLIGDSGPTFFASNVKDAEIPGEAVPGVKTFNGTVISMEPADKPIKVIVGVEDPAKADASLLFTNPLPAAALEKIKVGGKIEFSGVADSFTKEPYMLTFKDPSIPGVQLVAPAKKPVRRPAHK